MFKAPKTETTARFYDQLIDGSVRRVLWGSDSRFSPQKIASSTSTSTHYESCVREICATSDTALDIGCSTGGFTSVLAKYCAQVLGIDLSKRAVDLANKHFEQEVLRNCKAIVADGAAIPANDAEFDIVQLIDVVHHSEDPAALLKDVARVLKADGSVVIFEPNKYNVLLWLMCLFDKNEWGALRFGSKNAYKKLLTDQFSIVEMEHNGLLVGPSGKLSLTIANWVTKSNFSLARSQSPKIKIVLKKKTTPAC